MHDREHLTALLQAQVPHCPEHPRTILRNDFSQPTSTQKGRRALEPGCETHWIRGSECRDHILHCGQRPPVEPESVTRVAACKAKGAVLVIGKLDRLARDVRFFLEVIDDSGVDIRFADLPDVCPASDEGRMILVSMANFAEFEGRRIGTRTKAALAAAKARGIQLGLAGRHNLKPNIEARQAAAGAFAAGISGLVAGFRARSLSQRAMVAELNAAKVPAPLGGNWRLSQVQRLLGRLPVTL